jgi:hypothetical protein
MASSAQEAAVERKLRPIYDAIDCGNLKLALKSITAVREVCQWSCLFYHSCVHAVL